MRKIGIKKKGMYILGGAAIALMSVFCKETPALAASYTYTYSTSTYNVTTDGVKGTDYDFNDSTNVLTIKSSVPITVGGSNTTGQIGHILITGTQDVNLTISNLDIRKMEYTTLASEPPIMIDDNYTGKATITISGASNRLSGSGAPAIQKNGDKSRLVLDGSGTLTAYVSGHTVSDTVFPAVIGGAAGKSTANITIDGGTYVLNSYSGGACIGGGSSNTYGNGGDAKNITINAGTITGYIMKHTSSSFESLIGMYTGAVIGAGGNGDADGIYINGGTITAYNNPASPSNNIEGGGAVIGGGCNGTANNICISGGTVKATVGDGTKGNDKCGSGIGGGYKTTDSGWTMGNSITISGGYVVAKGVSARIAGIGSYGYLSKPDKAKITITGGTILANGGQYAPGIGGGRYCSSEVYISGGNVRATGGSGKVTDIGLEAEAFNKNKTTEIYTDILKRSETEQVDVSVQSLTNSELASKSVYLTIWDSNNTAVASDYYGTNDLKADNTGTVYVYLPAGYTLKEISADSSITVDLSQVKWADYSPYYYSGKQYSMRLDSSTIPEGVDITYNDKSDATNVGDYTAIATAKAKAGYKTTGSIPEKTWSVTEYPFSPVFKYYDSSTQKTSTTKAASYSESVTITAGELLMSRTFGTGYTYTGITVSESENVPIYFKDIQNSYMSVTPVYVDIVIKPPTEVNTSECTWDYTEPFTYDGREHEVKLNVPEGVKVTYSGTQKATDVKTDGYTVTATLTAEDGYVLSGDTTKSLTWYINEYSVTPTLKYNGSTTKETSYSDDVTVTADGYYIDTSYTGSFSSDEYVFDQTGTAKLYFKNKITGYITTTYMSVSVTIQRLTHVDVSGISWNYTSAFTYDGNEHSVSLTNVPEGVDVTYSETTSATAIGEYTAKVSVTPKSGYTFDGTFSDTTLNWEIKEKEKTPVDISGISWDYSSAYTYNGKEYSVALKNVPEGVNVTYSGITKATDIGSYTAKVSLTEKDGYQLTGTFSKTSLSWKIQEYTASPELTYNGSAVKQEEYESAVVIKAEGYMIDTSKTGSFNSDQYTASVSQTVELYFKNKSTGYITTTPVSVQITINNYTYVDVSQCSWNYSGPYTYNKKEYSVSLNAPAGVKVTYTGTTSATDINTYTVTANLTPEDGYKFSNEFNDKTLTWKINEYSSDSIEVKYNSDSLKDWYTGTVKITASGHKIRKGATGDFENIITISNTENVTLYFQSSEGYLTTKGVEAQINIDKTKPTGTIEVDGQSYNSINTGSQIKSCHLKNYTVKLSGSDAGSGVDSVQYALYGGDTPYTTASDIENAGLTWLTAQSFTFTAGKTLAVYAKITDKVGNVTYVSTPIISDDNSAPVVNEAILNNETSESVNYSIKFDDNCSYCYVLLKSSTAAPKTMAAVKTAAGVSGNEGEGTGKELSGTFTGLDANESYILYVAAEDGQVSLSNVSNSNVSTVKSSNTVTTLQKEIAVPDQTMPVKTGLSAKTYTYDLKEMLNNSSISTDVLGSVTYVVSKENGSILSGNPSVSGDTLNIPVGSGFAADLSQKINITFKFGNTAYKSAQAVLTVNSVAKTPLRLDSSINISDKEYDGNVASYNGTIKWINPTTGKEQSVSGTEVLYTGSDYSGNAYSSSAAPKNAGEYSVTFKVSDSDEDYTGSKTLQFVITKKDLSSQMNIKWLINGSEYNKGEYYADGTNYTLTVTGYPAEIVPSYTGNTGNQANVTYNAVAKYSVASGYSSNNYMIPDDSTLAWTLEFFDNIAPTGKIILNDGAKTYETINKNTAVNRVHESSITAVISGADEHSNISKIEYAFAASVYSSETAIENANLSWKTGTVGGKCQFSYNNGTALYIRITDGNNNKTYVSTPLFYNDTSAPSVSTAVLSNATETTVDYSFTLTESANYYMVLLKSSDTAPKTVADIEERIAAGNPGKIDYNKEASGTIRNLVPNVSYRLYVIADDGAKTISGGTNANVSAIKSSSNVTTKQREVSVSDQVFSVKTGLSARTYTYDLSNMLSNSGVDMSDLGNITYTAVNGSGSILSGDASVDGSMLSLPVGTGFAAGVSQPVTVTFVFGNSSYKSATAKLVVNSVAKTPLSLSNVVMQNKIYDGQSVGFTGTPTWKDSDGNYVSIGSAEIKYTGTAFSGNIYNSTTAPKDAGTYTLIIKIPDDNESYTGLQSFDFNIFKKDLDDYMSSVKWNINNELYNSGKTYYANGDTYTVSVTGYPSEVVPEYNSECSGKEAKTYHAMVAFKIASGYDQNNYELPDNVTLAWTLTEKQEQVEIEKETPDLSEVEWSYYRISDGDKTEFADDSTFVEEEGVLYGVEIDKATLPEGIDRNNISYTNASGNTTGDYETVAQFKVVDEEKYNVPDSLTLKWSIKAANVEPDPDPDVPKVKTDIDMSGINWVYVSGDVRNEYNGNTVLYADGSIYSLEINNLPAGVSVVSYKTERMIESLAGTLIPEEKQTGYDVDNNVTEAGAYKTTVTLNVDDPDNYNVPEPISFRWKVYEQGAVIEVPDPGPQQIIPSIGSISTYSGAKYKVLTSGAQGGTVEYDGQEKADKKATKITIPATVTIEGQTYKVTTVKSGTFNGYKKLKSVTIGKNVEEIGDKAFYKCTALKSVVIPANVTTIGKNAFYGCKKLSKITIKSKKLKKVGNNAIKGINKKAVIKCPSKKLAKQYKKKLFKSKTGYKKTMKIK